MLKVAHKWLLSCSPEFAHDVALMGLPLLPLQQDIIPDPVELMGLRFPNRIGLAAGLDKNGDALSAWKKMGFGFVEIGTVTPVAQPGNDKPRLFRIPEKKALINRMGFNNKGIDNLLHNLEEFRLNNSDAPIIGVNIGKNAHTPLEQSVRDYLICFEKAYCLADYIAINVSSPNTRNLRSLQQEAALENLLGALKEKQRTYQTLYGKYTPLVLKIAPDLTDEELKGCAAAVIKTGFDGVIATNTTLERSYVEGCKHAEETGGLSGAVLSAHSTRIIKTMVGYLPDSIPVIASGGICSAEDAQQKLEAGAQLIQLFTGFIYEGPALIRQISDSITY